MGYLRFNEAACFFTLRLSSLKICNLASPLGCLCVIRTTCSVPFLLPYIYIPFPCALRCVTVGLCSLRKGRCSLSKAGVDPGRCRFLCGRVAPLTQLWPRQKPRIDQRAAPRRSPPLPEITASVIYFFRRFTALIA